MKTMVFIFTMLFILSPFTTQSQSTDIGPNFLKKISPHNIKLQFAGNIGFLSTGIGYESGNSHWKGDIFYGFVPEKYAADDSMHLLTFKGKYGTVNRAYQNVDMQWVNMGLWINYTFGEQYFVKLPEYYEPGYYLIRPGLNIGAFVGSQLKYKRMGVYYEVGTTDKHVIHFLKNLQAIPVTYIFNTAIGVVYHLKQ